MRQPRRAAVSVCGRRCASRRGFTLIEIMVVVILIGIVTAMVVPNLSNSLGGRNLDATTEQISNLFDYCYNAALSSGRVWGIVFAPDRKSFKVVTCWPNEDEDAGGEDAEWDDAPELETVNVPGLSDTNLPEGIELKDVNVADDSLLYGEEQEIRILFFPDGTTEFATLSFADDTGARRNIDLNGLSGTVRVYNPEISEPKSGPVYLDFGDALQP